MPVFAMRMINRLLVLMLVSSLITGCTVPVAEESAPGSKQPQPTPVVETQTAEATQGISTAAPPRESTPRLETPADETTSTPAPVRPLLWIDPGLPARFHEQLTSQNRLATTSQKAAANFRIQIPSIERVSAGVQQAEEAPRDATYWVYAVVAPFPTVLDTVERTTIHAAWNGRPPPAFGRKPLLMSAETRAVLERYWGPPTGKGIRVAAPEDLLDSAWNEMPAWAVIPFEEIQPRWKVLRLDGQSPLENDFEPEAYPLAIPVWLTAAEDAWAAKPVVPVLPTNRDPQKLTVLVLTGVTALSRHIAARMETEGSTYPARDIGDWLAAADLTHISNEVSFYQDCPKPGPERADMRFCSHPKYIELLEHIGVDIVELTGNHNLDWGRQPYLDTLEMYRERGWGIYGGGANLNEAQQPLLVEHNGNRLAFLGCSPAGPEKVWATAGTPGAAPCDFPRLEEQIRALRAQGILPVVTLQAVETDTYLPTPAQGMINFRKLAAAGAVIVSGSQAHVPQTMTFVENSFVHYGLGNLFFDQMEPPRARQQFIDRHVFYDGQYLGVELLTALLEDFARPRPMETAERESFLETLFALCDWNGKIP